MPPIGSKTLTIGSKTLMTDALAAAAWFAVNLAVLATAWRMGRCAFPTDSAAQLAMHAIVIVWASIVTMSVALGAMGALDALRLGICELAIAGAVNARLWRRFRAKVTVPRPVGVDSACIEPRRVTRGLTPPARRFVDIDSTTSKRWQRRAETALWSALGALAGAIVIARLLEFPKHWDDLMYHLPLVDHWLREGSLYVPACAEWYNPGNAELLGLWCVAPFSGDFWVGMANLPAVVLLALGTFELGRLLGVAPLLRHATAAAALATQIVLMQLGDLENDVAVAALFLAWGRRLRGCWPVTGMRAI